MQSKRILVNGKGYRAHEVYSVEWQGSSWALTVWRSDFSLQENLGEVTVKSGEVILQNYSIFCQFRSKMSHYTYYCH